MKKKHLFILLLLSACTYIGIKKIIPTRNKSMPGISQATTQLESITHKNIIFDLTGVLLDVSQRFLLSEIGYLNMVWYGIRHMKNPLNAFKILFTLLDQVHPSTEEQYTYKDNKVPKSICDWGMGRMNNTEIKTICKKAFDEFDAKQ